MKAEREIKPVGPLPREAAFQHPRKESRPAFEKISVILSGGAILLGSLVAAVALLPRITVDISTPVDPGKAFSSTFSVLNTSVIPLNAVNFFVGICRVDMNVNRPFDPRLPRALTIRGDNAKFRAGSAGCTGPNGAAFHERNWIDQKLAPDGRFSASLSRVFVWMTPPQVREAITVTAADITVVVQFQPWIIPWRREFEFRFATQRVSDGVRWGARSLGDK
jgi:hypothetical protein